MGYFYFISTAFKSYHLQIFQIYDSHLLLELRSDATVSSVPFWALPFCSQLIRRNT